MNTKIYYYIIGWLVLGIIGLLLFQNIPSQIQYTNTPVVIDTWIIVNTWSVDSGSLVTGSQNNPLVYTNTEYGFQLTLPEGWEDYKVFSYDMSKNPWSSGLNNRIVLALPTKEKMRPGILDPNDSNWFIPEYTGQYKFIKWYADMIILNLWTPEWYNKEQQRCNIDPNPSCIGSTELLWNNQSYYFTYFGPQDLPVDISAKIKFASYYEDIKNSFKIL